MHEKNLLRFEPHSHIRHIGTHIGFTDGSFKFGFYLRGWFTLPLIKSRRKENKIFVTFTSKFQFMKRFVVAVVLVAGAAVAAFASFNNNRKKAVTEKRSGVNPVEKKTCRHTCPFS